MVLLTARRHSGFRVDRIYNSQLSLFVPIVLQSILQLYARYRQDMARSTQNGFNTDLTYAGSDPETAQFFERVIGKVRERQKNVFLDQPKPSITADQGFLRGERFHPRHEEGSMKTTATLLEYVRL